jgi:hypothetical protein
MQAGRQHSGHRVSWIHTILWAAFRGGLWWPLEAGRGLTAALHLCTMSTHVCTFLYRTVQISVTSSFELTECDIKSGNSGADTASTLVYSESGYY